MRELELLDIGVVVLVKESRFFSLGGRGRARHYKKHRDSYFVTVAGMVGALARFDGVVVGQEGSEG